MNYIDKIISDSKREILVHVDGGHLTSDNCERIIKSAIEKAYALGVDEMTQAGIKAMQEQERAKATGFNYADHPPGHPKKSDLDDHTTGSGWGKL